jgi:hypothetical protein
MEFTIIAGSGSLFCHPKPGPEPSPETSSGSVEFRIYRVRDLCFENLVFPSGIVETPRLDAKFLLR